MTLPDLANTLQRLTIAFPPDNQRKAHIEALRNGNPASLPYARKELERFVEVGKGLLRSEARKALQEFPS